MIRLNEEQLRSGTSAMKSCGEALAAIDCGELDMTGNSETLKSYIECFERLQDVMNAYSVLLQRDSDKILSAGEALIEEDKSVLVVPID